MYNPKNEMHSLVTTGTIKVDDVDFFEVSRDGEYVVFTLHNGEQKFIPVTKSFTCKNKTIIIG